jgi:glycosyltransferase involved in cell wall biosynthesis
LLRSHQTQILHTHNPIPHYYGILALLPLSRLRVVNTRHGMGNAPFHFRRELFYRFAMARTDAVALVCDRARRNFVTHGIVPRGKAHVVPNGIRLNEFQVRSVTPHERLRQVLGLAEGAFVVGNVARLNPVKDHATLLRAFARVLENVGHAVLVVVGGGGLYDDLVALAKRLGISEKVRFLGDREDVKELLPGFDLFALSSTTEGYSISLVEACAAGLPVVATDVGGNSEIIRAGVNGLLVAPGDGESLAAAVVRLARDAELRDTMGQAGRNWAVANGASEIMAQRYRALYLGVADRLT